LIVKAQSLGNVTITRHNIKGGGKKATQQTYGKFYCHSSLRIGERRGLREAAGQERQDILQDPFWSERRRLRGRRIGSSVLLGEEKNFSLKDTCPGKNRPVKFLGAAAKKKKKKGESRN